MHRNARLTPTGRRIMIERIAAGMPQAHVAEQMLVSRATVSKWWRRWLAEGDAGLEDRSSRPVLGQAALEWSRSQTSI